MPMQRWMKMKRRTHRHPVVRGLVMAAAALALTAVAAGATMLDFGAALQAIPPGTTLGTVTLANGARMTITTTNHGSGPDLSLVFDSSHPTGGDVDEGTPNEDFGGPGKGAGGEAGQPGQNDVSLGHLLVIADNDIDLDGDGLVDVPEDEADGGVMRLEFSHAGFLSLYIVDVDFDEGAPELHLFKDGSMVGVVSGAALGNNSLQHLDASGEGMVDAVEIHLGGSSGIAGIVLDVPVMPVESTTWSTLKGDYRGPRR